MNKLLYFQNYTKEVLEVLINAFPSEVPSFELQGKDFLHFSQHLDLKQSLDFLNECKIIKLKNNFVRLSPQAFLFLHKNSLELEGLFKACIKEQG